MKLLLLALFILPFTPAQMKLSDQKIMCGQYDAFLEDSVGAEKTISMTVEPFVLEEWVSPNRKALVLVRPGTNRVCFLQVGPNDER